jgi:hypothetical protein
MKFHIQPYMDFKGGNVVGNAFNNSSLTTAAYTFMISSIASNFQEVIHIFSTSTMKRDTLFDCIRTVVSKLKKIGYRVFCLLIDNNAVNGMIICTKKKRSIVDPHPCDNTRPLFFL